MSRQLTIWIDRSLVGEGADLLASMYREAANKHNVSVTRNRYPDAGFDILTPFNGIEDAGYIVNGQHTQMKLRTGIRCSMEKLIVSGHDRDVNPLSYYMYPRSSISKTPYRLANSVGIIDSGYRGELIGVFDVSFNNDGTVPTKPQPYSRLVQICCGDLKPFTVRIEEVDAGDVDDLIASTKRGDGGFGSTGV